MNEGSGQQAFDGSPNAYHVQLGATNTTDANDPTWNAEQTTNAFSCVARNGNSGDYRYGFNGMEKLDEIAGVTGSHLDFGARIYNSRLGRWMSPDPLEDNFPSYSPYNFAVNSPLIFVDPNGKENVIYLVLLDDGNSAIQKMDIGKIVENANNTFKSHGLNTRVVIYTGCDVLNPAKMDKTDSYAILGSTEGITNYISHQNFEDRQIQQRAIILGDGGSSHPEESSVNKDGILLHAEGILGYADEIKTDVETAAAYLIAHGAGHNVKSTHGQEPLMMENLAKEINPSKQYLSNGNYIEKMLKDVNSIEDALDPAKNTKYKQNMEDNKYGSNSFGTEKSVDNMQSK
jgi:RHS repeat-associated protein